MLVSLIFAVALASSQTDSVNADMAQECQGPLQGEQRLLRSEENVDLCELSQGKVTLVVNTASQCGFVGQFESLEELYQSYKEQGFQVIGFPSNSFRQEHGDEQQTAEVCYVNYGVTFPMVATSNVRGQNVNPVFAELSLQTGKTPRWNFYKYLVGRDGEVLEVYSSTTRPDDQTLLRDIERAL